MSSDEARRHGFRLTKKELEDRRKSEKIRKWNERLDREDIVKLRAELDSLNRATFLAPHQCERKRLVERLIRDLERRNCNDSVSASKPQEESLDREQSVCSSSSEDCDNLFVSTITESTVMDGFPTKADQILPRSLRKRQKEDVVDDRYRKRIRNAEDALLSSNTVGDNLEEFFDSL
ncbi:uncharacterized protein TM35_000481030 [Trypanosoma theileri]|uniref:Uncharacterized protein n=1 Tax=Trypanosoma theileri TaxID=67003 RepID=A0A1X0NH88_9TRYP|nr:uncharacterized protein TM35_000481030 [Trypanosoma theileri]ORC84142.1 hypothetical protein TM35_000481030 [Trypanosoma theileri]